MQFPNLNPRWLLLNVFCKTLLLCTSSSLECAAATYSNESDRLALLDFKKMIIEDPLQIMNSWNDSINFCSWVGVSCSSTHQRVVILNLQSQKLTGTIPPSIGNLTFLTGINLQNNSFHGKLPEELGRLQRLQHINLTYNFFGGKIPTNLTHCSQLQTLALSYNEFMGNIPSKLSSLLKLVILSISVNNLTGTIPAWIGNFSSLYILSLIQNNLQGSIPNELGQLRELGYFQLYGNNLTGTIPSSIYNISSIFYFTVTQNQLHGQLPQNIGLTLPRLQIFAGGVNKFTGPIPVSLSNASQLMVLDFAQNGLTGTVPVNLRSLQKLERLNFDDNFLGNKEADDLNFIISLANCTSLEVLGLSRNRFGGILPNSIANLSTQLQILTLGENLIHGSIPIGIENLFHLSLLGLEGNYLSGSIPDVLGKLQNLEGLHLNVNRFSGSIPYSFGNFTRLTRLFMEENRFEGKIPRSLKNCKNLQNLNLSSNNLNGSIPAELIGLSSLSISLVLSRNALTGSIPLEIGNLENLMQLDFSDNKLSGEIPSTLGKCISLERLHMEGNVLEGPVPDYLETLRGLEELDLSRNNLSGKIPKFLSKLSSLRLLNLSHNDFEGEVWTEGVFANASNVSVAGNDKLCGGISQLLLPKCSKGRRNQAPTTKTLILATIAVSLFLLCGSVMFYLILKMRTKSQRNTPPSEGYQGHLTYSEIMISTNGFAEENLIGSGSFGSVYKGILSSHEKVVAIKVLNLQQQGALESFFDECNALRVIRHRNLLKIVTSCSTVDYQGNDFKALVFEFMPNGSLDQWLHPRGHEQHLVARLSFNQRLNIAIDVASALDYLHHHCEPPIVHCDLKPSNILLDEDITARVGDFGLARFLFEVSECHAKIQQMSMNLKGSIGYIPPEYGIGGEISVLGDAYSYGILLLEMFTGRRPTDDMFTDDLSNRKFVEMALPQHAMDIIDETMLVEEENDENEQTFYKMDEQAIMRDGDTSNNRRSKIAECLVSIFGIGLSCSEKLPRQRMTMNVAVNKLQGIRDSFLRSENNKR